MFQSYLEYGILLWGSAAQSIVKPIELLQKKAIRIVSNSTYNAHTDPLFKAQNILKVKDIHELHVNNFMYQYHNSHLPTSLSNLFTRNNNRHNHRTRHRNDPYFTHRRTALAAQSIIYRGPKL